MGQFSMEIYAPTGSLLSGNLQLNLAEIAEVLAVSIPRVHQLKAQALDKLKEALGDGYEVL